MRRCIALNGTWDFLPDLDPKYHGDPLSYPSPELARPQANRRHWQRVPVPGAWQKYAERYDIFEGVCWYAREFEVDDLTSGDRAFLRFGAVNYLCRVFLNGVEVGGHEGGYTEFVVNATAAMTRGRNHLAVMVDNRATTIKWPPCLGYFNYGGIHRGVTLEILAGPCLESPVISARWDHGAGTLTAAGTVWVPAASGPQGSPPAPGQAKLEVSLECHGRTARAAVDAQGRYHLSLAIPDALPWSPTEPALSQARLVLMEEGRQKDARELEAGFRTIRCDQGNLTLNGSPLELRGICYVYDSPASGLVMTEDQLAQDIGLIKELGCNAVRCHYPMDELFYRLCDRAGLLVWIEPPVYCYHPASDACNTGFSLPAWHELALGMVSEMIATGRVHPSVAIYGIGNECNSEHPEAQAFFRSLAERIRSEDPDRLVSYAALYGKVGPLGEIVDVLGVNSYFGWYDKVFVDPLGSPKGAGPGQARPEPGPESVALEPIDLSAMRAMLDKVMAGLPRRVALLLTEFGADSVAGYCSRGLDLWSEDYHARLLQKVTALAEEYPRIVGTFPFCFSDYRDPSKVHNGYWNELNLKGVVDYARNRKLAFDALRAVYTGART